MSRRDGMGVTRRDAVIKAAARAKSPSAVDLSLLRQRSAADGPQVKASREDMLGAMAFASMDWWLADEHGDAIDEGPGNPLNVALLQLKYAAPLNRRAFDNAHRMLMVRHVLRAPGRGPHRTRGRRPTDIRPSDTMMAIGTVALFEWVFDGCAACRDRSIKAVEPRPCNACPPAVVPNSRKRDAGRKVEVETPKKGLVRVTTTRPNPGCPKCGGLGRIFREPRKPRGMVCGKCGNTGRAKSWEPGPRLRAVNELLDDLAHRRQVGYETAKDKRIRRDLEKRGAKKPRPIARLAFRAFMQRWHPKYLRFLDILRASEKDLVPPIDLQVTRMENRGIVRELEEEDMLEDESDVDSPTSYEPDQPTGELPPNESSLQP